MSDGWNHNDEYFSRSNEIIFCGHYRWVEFLFCELNDFRLLYLQ